MDILCLMGLFPEEYREQIEKDSIYGIQYAADKLQGAIVRGLSENNDIHVSIVNSLYIGSYPRRYREKRIPSFQFQYAGKVPGENIGFCNLTGYKWISRYYGIRKAIKAWAKRPSNQQKVLLIYALTTPFVQMAAYVKRKFPNIKVCVVVPDLPEYMNTAAMQSKGIYHYAKSAEIAMIRKSIRKVDCYVLLTDTMKEWFDEPITYTVVEGMASMNSCCDEQIERKQTILYAGGIKEEYGVIDLVNAFIDFNDPKWELEIYGDGPAMEEIRKLSETNANIRVMGLVPNQKVVHAQRRSSVLVNPRKNQIFTRYSFPSKILEYMSSGTPVLAYKLDGIPDDYDGYYFQIEDQKNGFLDALRNVTGITPQERNIMGENARKFVQENKTPQKQCKKIVDMLLKLFENGELK